MMLPRPAVRIARAAARTVARVPTRLTAKAPSNVDQSRSYSRPSVDSTDGPPAIPALANTAWGTPRSATLSSMACSIAAGSAMSHSRTEMRAPGPPSAAALCFSPSPSRSIIVTWAPNSSSPWQIARPSPLAAPVTATCLPAMLSRSARDRVESITRPPPPRSTPSPFPADARRVAGTPRRRGATRGDG